MTSKRQLRKQSKEIWKQMQEENPELRQPTFCEKHPKMCKAGKTAAAIGLGTVMVAGEIATGTTQGVSVPITTKKSSPKNKSTGDTKKKSPATAQKRSQAKKSTTAKKKSTTKKKTSRKAVDDLDYWRL